jgi:hypothetical protein
VSFYGFYLFPNFLNLGSTKLVYYSGFGRGVVDPNLFLMFLLVGMTRAYIQNFSFIECLEVVNLDRLESKKTTTKNNSKNIELMASLTSSLS